MRAQSQYLHWGLVMLEGSTKLISGILAHFSSSSYPLSPLLKQSTVFQFYHTPGESRSLGLPLGTVAPQSHDASSDPGPFCSWAFKQL